MENWAGVIASLQVVVKRTVSVSTCWTSIADWTVLAHKLHHRKQKIVNYMRSEILVVVNTKVRIWEVMPTRLHCITLKKMTNLMFTIIFGTLLKTMSKCPCLYIYCNIQSHMKRCDRFNDQQECYTNILKHRKIKQKQVTVREIFFKINPLHVWL